MTAVAAIYVDNTGRFGQNPLGSFPPTTTILTGGTDYALHYDGCLPGTGIPCSYCGIVERIPDVWTGGIRRKIGEITPRYTEATGNILVNYTAGYAIVPPAVEMAACMFVIGLRRNQTTGGGNIQSESQGAYQYSLSAPVPNTMPELGTIKQALARYKRMEI